MRIPHSQLAAALRPSTGLLAVIAAVLIAAPVDALAQGATPPPAGPSSNIGPRPTGQRVTNQQNHHGLGVTGGFAPGSGFSYRRFFGRNSLQATVFAMVTNRGDDATVFSGLSFTRYLLVWHEFNRPGILPDTSALRLTAGAAYLYRKSTDVETTEKPIDPTCKDKRNNKCAVEVSEATVSRNQWDAFLGAGIGFEFGAVMRPGFSLALDVQLTAMMDKEGVYELLPVPSLSLMYNW